MKLSVFKLTLFALTFVALSACKGYSKKEKAKFDKELVTFMKKEHLVMTKSSSGVYYKVVTAGKGKKILYADKIRVMYKGRKMDGTIFDEKNSPIEFNIRGLIPAWKEVLVGRNTGSVFYIATPPSMGYGSQEAGEIPPNSCLFFEIKVMEAL
jgi:FKBP-type peptidyl-prolyl cis-trans isomerase